MVKPPYQQPIDAKTYAEVLDLFDQVLRLMHPFMPFITEEIWQLLEERSEGESIMISQLPKAGEYNKEITKPQTNNPIKYKRPVNLDFVNQLIEQGTIEDEIRGTTSSSAQREFPSAVIGFSSPGPVDKRGGSPMANIGLKESKATMHVSRLGSSSIVIDDGDDKLHCCAISLQAFCREL
jgi:hypothetical protein